MECRGKGNAKRILSALLAAVMVLSCIPESALTIAVYAEETNTGLCDHHPKHTDECGYIAPTEGQPCGHKHTEECYTLGVLPGEESTEDGESMLDCQHVHDETCGYVPADPGQPCRYECQICPLQELIDALPDEDMITTDTAPDVKARLAGIDEAKAALTDEELDELDTARYEAIVSAVLALEGMEGANQIQTLESETTVRPKTMIITVTVSAKDPSWGTVAGGGSYTTDDSVTVTAKANPGYKFVRWTESGKEVSTSAEYTFTAEYENKDLIAEFAKKKISIRSRVVKGSAEDIVTGGTQTDLGATHTITITPDNGYSVVAGYFAGTDYMSNPSPYTQYEKMTLEKLSTDPDTGAVTYRFTATECIPIDNDQTYDYICLYFYCAKAPTYSWFLDTVYGAATAPSPDGSIVAKSYESEYDLCADPNKNGYYQLNNAKDRAYLSWEVESVTNANDPTEELNGTVSFENNKLHYTPTYKEAGKIVRIQVRPKLGDGMMAQEPLVFEITVGYPKETQIKDVSETLDDVRKPEALLHVQDTVRSGNHYTVSISWSPETSGVYGFNTVYTATLTLTPERGYLLHSIDCIGWTWKQGTPDGGAVIYKTFPATRKEKITALDTIGDVTLEIHTDKDGVIAKLPTTVDAATETGETISMTLNWNCERFDAVPSAENTFTWTAVCDESYDASDVTLSGSITVTNPSALPVGITGTDSEVTYNGSAIDVSELYTIDENAGAESYSITGGTGEGTLSGSTLTVTKAGTFIVTVHTEAKGIYAAGEASATLTVKPKTLTPYPAGITEKIYDGTTDAPNGLYIELNGLVEGDNVTASAVYSYDSSDAGERTITATEITLSGKTAGNYILSGTAATAKGIIQQALLSITASDQTITYGGSIAQGTDQVKISGLKGSDGLDSITLTVTGDQVSEENSIVPSDAAVKNGETDVTANYRISYQPGQLTIEHLRISVPTAIALTYNGEEQTGVENGTGYTLEDNTGIDAGTYTAIATLDSGYCWEDGSTEAKRVTWCIARAKMDNVQANGYTGTYDGNAHGITITGYPSGVTVRYGTEDGTYDLTKSPTYTNTGTYTVYYQLTSRNYETVTGLATVMIERKAIDYPVVNTGLVYNGQVQTGVESGEGYTLDSVAAKNAGNYTATVSLNANYKWSDGKTENVTIDWSIGKKEITSSITANGGVYNGQPFPASVKLEGVAENETVTVTLTYTKEGETTVSATAPTDVGTYTVTATITDSNYDLTGLNSKDFTITPASIEGVKVTVDGSYTYTGAAHTPDPTVKLENKTLTRDIDYTVSYAGNVDAGTAAVTVTGTGNYTGEATGEFTIGKAVITDVSATVDSVEVPEAWGTVQNEVEDGSGYTGEIMWTPAASDKQYGFNTAYTAALSLTPDENHVFGELSQDGWSVTVGEDGKVILTKTFPATRKEKVTSLSTIEDVTLEEHTATAAGVIVGLPAAITAATEAGTASLPIFWSCEDYDTAPNAQNIFTWTVTDVGSYNAGGVTLTGTIKVTNPSALPVSITGTDKEVTYNGSTIDVSELFTIDGNAGAASYRIIDGTGEGTLNGSVLTVTKAGTFTVTVHTAAKGIYAGATADVTLTVNKGIGAGSVTIEDWTYGETAKNPVPESDTNGSNNVTYTYVLSDETVVLPKDAGTYTVIAAFGETDLYNGCTASTEFTIECKPVTVTITPNGGVYGGEITGATAVLHDVVTGDTAPTVTLIYTGKANDGTEVHSTDVPAKAGTYTVTASINSDNYTLTGTAAAEFRVDRAESSLTVAEIAEKTYGDEDFTLEVTAGAGRDIRYVSSNPAVVTVDEAGKVHIVGAGKATVIVTLAEDANFLSKQQEVSVKIARKPIRVIAESAGVTYGEPVPNLSYTVTTEDLVGEDALTGITVTRQEGEDAGEYTVTPTQEEGANPNYDVEFIIGKLIIQPKNIGNAEIVLGPALIANSKEQTQTLESVTVKNSKGEDMEVTYTVTGNTAVNAGGYTMTITGTGNFTGTKEQSFVIAPGTGQPVETDGNGNPVLGKGTITVQVISGDGDFAVDMGTSKAEIIELLIRNGDLTAQELAQVADGAERKIIFTISGSVSDDDQSQIKSLADGYTIGIWFDISLYKQLGEGDIVWLHETQKPVRLTVQVPENLMNTDKNVTRTFWIIRCHDGNAEFLPTQYDDSSKTLSFETDRYSGYAIVYKDTKNTDSSQNTATGTTPQTGDSNRVDLWLAMMAISALGLGILLNANRKKRRIY